MFFYFIFIFSKGKKPEGFDLNTKFLQNSVTHEFSGVLVSIRLARLAFAGSFLVHELNFWSRVDSTRAIGVRWFFFLGVGGAFRLRW